MSRLTHKMDAASTIRQFVKEVTRRREQCASDPGLTVALRELKLFQARRFANSYQDILGAGPYMAAARFFLDELYGAKDYSERDAQFSRIAGALQRVFPEDVVQTAVALAELHALSEDLDFQMAQIWRAPHIENVGNEAKRYVNAWAKVGRRSDRARQVDMVLTVGAELERLTRATGLRLMLKMMRRPAQLAGLGSLQAFLELGFDTFATMSKHPNAATKFLQLIQSRETTLIDVLFRADSAEACTALKVSGSLEFP